MKTYQAVLAALMANGASARLWVGACPEMNWISPFDSAAFAGQWYEQSKDAVFYFGGKSKCSTAEYTLNSEGTLDTAFRAKKAMGGYGGAPPGTLDCSESSNCELTMAGSDKSVQWGILDTDYENWQVSYWCGTLFGIQYSWLGVYGKNSPDLDPEYEAAANAAIEAAGYKTGWPYMRESPQDNCEYSWSS